MNHVLLSAFLYDQSRYYIYARDFMIFSEQVYPILSARDILGAVCGPGDRLLNVGDSIYGPGVGLGLMVGFWFKR